METRQSLVAGVVVLTLVLGVAGSVSAQSSSQPVDRARLAWSCGVIKTVDGVTIEIATPTGPLTVITDTNTLSRSQDQDTLGVDILEVGDVMVAVGWREDDSIIQAFALIEIDPDRDIPLVGKLFASAADSLALETRWGPAKVTVSSETAYRVPWVMDPGPDDLKEGTGLVVLGNLRPDGTMAARVVIAHRPDQPNRWLLGRASANGERRAIVRTLRGRLPARAFGRIRVRGLGHRIALLDSSGSPGLVIVPGVAGIGRAGATRLGMVLPKSEARLVGELVAVEDGTLVVESGQSLVEIVPADGASVRFPGGADATIDDLIPGEMIVAGGTWEDRKTFYASQITVRWSQRPGAPAIVRGWLVAHGESELVIGTQRGPLTVVVSAHTRFSAPGLDAAGPTDMSKGQHVQVRGRWTENGTLEAELIRVLSAW